MLCCKTAARQLGCDVQTMIFGIQRDGFVCCFLFSLLLLFITIKSLSCGEIKSSHAPALQGHGRLFLWFNRAEFINRRLRFPAVGEKFTVTKQGAGVLGEVSKLNYGSNR